MTITTAQPTPALIAGIDAALVQAPRYAHIGQTHAEFVEWLRSDEICDRVYDRAVDFLTQRGDCAGSSPAAWTRLVSLGRTHWFAKVPAEQRSTISRFIIGDQAFDAYVAWLLDGLNDGSIVRNPPRTGEAA